MDGPDDLIDEILAGRAGPTVGAFFDFDGTLISGYSAGSFYLDRLRHRDLSGAEALDLLLALIEVAWRGGDAQKPLRAAIAQWRGRPVRDLEEMADRLFRDRIAACLFPEARALVDAHQRMGHTVAIATSATRFQAGPAASDLGVEHLMCTEVGVRDGLLTGDADGPILWGESKAEAVRKFAASRNIALEESFAYANGDEDIPFLGTVGRPRPVNAQTALAAAARARGWPLHGFEERGPSFRLAPVVRTAAAVAAGVGLLRRSRRHAANLAISMGSDLVLGLTGVKLEVEGEEHLHSHRPAVFVFNHQSGIDPFILGALLRRDVTAVAKKQLAFDPRVAPIGYLVDVAYVDRGNITQAKEALAPALERLKAGVSVAMAPEGTRSRTVRLGRFKKGAFHLALQAGVPVVPIVIRNSGEVMWARSNVVRPGTVQVRVLPPVSTQGWSAEDLDARVAEVRQMFLDALASWPLLKPKGPRP
ncbi:MAG: HAD-IB family hydrolase [Deltaproteobacteria bacterium]|nr:HAD-IB family hydrolase [Deltaproteobacteria bacterium]